MLKLIRKNNRISANSMEEALSVSFRMVEKNKSNDPVENICPPTENLQDSLRNH